jgi:putative transposase
MRSSILRRGDAGLQAGEETPLPLPACPAYLFGSYRISLVFVRTAYKCLTYPDPEQASMLNRTFGCVRVVWNRTLAWRHQRYRAEKAATSLTQANAYLTAMKTGTGLAWLNEVSSVPLQQAIRHQQGAYTAFFAKRARYPRFKSRQGRQSAEYTRSGFRWRDGALFLAKTDTPLAFTWSWPDVDPASLDPSTVTVSRDPCGRWYVSFAVDVPDPEQLPAAGRVAGVDLGVKDFAVTSDGQRIPNPRHLQRRALNLGRYQRRLARCQRGSANRAKAKAKVARAHRKVRAARTDFLHKASTRLVRGHDVIVLEDLAVKNMVRNRTLAKAISDCGWSTFRAMIEYKAARYGRRVITAGRWYPSSKTCSACGHLLGGCSGEGVGGHLPSSCAQPVGQVEQRVARVLAFADPPGDRRDARGWVAVAQELEWAELDDLGGEVLADRIGRVVDALVTLKAEADEIVVLGHDLAGRAGEVDLEDRHIAAQVVDMEDQVVGKFLAVPPEDPADA